MKLRLFVEGGHTFSINGIQRQFRGALAMFLGDTLASQAIGGFKIGVGFALRKCRNCMATGDQIQTLVRKHAVK